jgi:hypothetical protein
MLATLASAAAAPPLAPPGAADAPTLDLYVGDERRTTITTNFGTATEALAAAVLRAGDPGDAVEGRVVLAARIGGEAFEFVDPPSTALRPGDALINMLTNNPCTWVGFCSYPRPFRYQIDGRAIVLSENGSDFGRADLTMN